MVPDADGDGAKDVLVGAPTYGSTGRVHLLSGDTGEQVDYVTGRDDQEHRRFGQSVSFAGDADGDGGLDVAVGAPTSNGSNGRVVLFTLENLRRIREITGPEKPSPDPDDPPTGSEFGSAPAWASDGEASRLLVGAPQGGFIFSFDFADSDQDGFLDDCDNCPNTPTPPVRTSRT